MADRYDDRYRGEEYRGERGYGRDDRGFIDRAGDEVRSWFGDEEAERRRRMDEQRYGRDWDWGHRMGYGYGAGRPPTRDWGARGYGYRGERGWSGERWGGERPEYGRMDYGRTDYDRPWSREGNEPPRVERFEREGHAGYYARPSAGFGPGPGGYGTGYGYVSTAGLGSAYGFRDYDDTGRYGHGWERGRGIESWSGRGPRGYQRSDDRIREDVCDRLTDDPWVDASEVEVTVRNAEVTLSGTVRDREDKRRTEDITENISGVREVHNNLRVGSGWEGTRQADTTPTPAATSTKR